MDKVIIDGVDVSECPFYEYQTEEEIKARIERIKEELRICKNDKYYSNKYSAMIRSLEWVLGNVHDE